MFVSNIGPHFYSKSKKLLFSSSVKKVVYKKKSLFSILFGKIKFLVKHAQEEEEVNETSSTNESLVLQKKEKYFKMLQENDELNELIRRRQELLASLELLLNPNANAKPKTVIDNLVMLQKNNAPVICAPVLVTSKTLAP